MRIMKLGSKPCDTPDQPNAKRRSFMRKLGAAIPAVLAAAAPGKPDTGFNRDDWLKNRMGMLEDESSVRGLHRTYENLLNNGRYEEIPELFTDDAEVVFNGGIFRAGSGGIQRLYCKRFKPGLTGRRMEQAPGVQPDTTLQPEKIQVAADRKSASASFPFSIQVGAPLVSDSSLVQMARLHGEGIRKWWEGGTYEISYVKEAKDEGWRIRKLEYRTLASADYRPGKSHAGSISVSAFSKAYPEDPAGPDVVIGHFRKITGSRRSSL